MKAHTRFYPIPLHGGGNLALPADREIYRKPPAAMESRP